MEPTILKSWVLLFSPPQITRDMDSPAKLSIIGETIDKNDESIKLINITSAFGSFAVFRKYKALPIQIMNIIIDNEMKTIFIMFEHFSRTNDGIIWNKIENIPITFRGIPFFHKNMISSELFLLFLLFIM